MKFGDWDVLWGKVDVTKVGTTIVNYAKMHELISYDYTNLCKVCSESGYLIKKLMKLDSTAYEQFLVSLKKDMHNKVMELWERVHDGYRGWQASHSYWKYSEYDSVDSRSRVELNDTINDNEYRIFVTFKIHKTKAMGDASISCEVIVVDADKLPEFGNYGVYYANMQDYTEKEFDIVLSAIQQSEVCFTYNNIGRVRFSDDIVNAVGLQYKNATGENMDTKEDSMYVRFAYDEKHGYIHIVVLHFLRDGSIVLHGSANKILRNNVCNIVSSTMLDMLEKIPEEQVSIGFPLYVNSSLSKDIFASINVSDKDVNAGNAIKRLIKVDEDKSKGFNDTKDKVYLMTISRRDIDKINVVITLLDNREAICLSQVL